MITIFKKFENSAVIGWLMYTCFQTICLLFEGEYILIFANVIEIELNVSAPPIIHMLKS